MSDGAASQQQKETIVDTERFRLRRFVETLAAAGELDIRVEPTDLIDVARHLDGNIKAVLFRQAGPEKAEMIGSVCGSRNRIAMAFGVPPRKLLPEIMKRSANLTAPCEVSTTNAPVHQVVLTGDQVDLTRLPIHLQHAGDGAPYISGGIDITRSVDQQRRNVGYRRLMLRGRKETGIDVSVPSHLNAAYAAYLQQKQRMPVAFAIGSHPCDSVAAMFSMQVPDEVAIMGAMRQAPVPLVRCVSIDAMAPADAEIVLEGYVDERGASEPEGPFGEFLGYYGILKNNPVFHVTAITMRRDALFQTATISGRHLSRTDAGVLTVLKTETSAWAALETAVREPVEILCTASSGKFNLRVSIRQRYPGEAKNAIAAVFGATADLKHVFVVDDDIDVYSDDEMDWALATRFQADRDLVVASGFRALPIDPSLGPARTGAKVGFDLTLPFGRRNDKDFQLPVPPVLGPSRNQSVRQSLATGPQTFRDLMEARGSRDGREIVLELDALRTEGLLERLADGRYRLKV